MVLEEREAAIARGAHIIVEICGYAANADAYHITSPSPEGRGAAQVHAKVPRGLRPRPQ